MKVIAILILVGVAASWTVVLGASIHQFEELDTADDPSVGLGPNDELIFIDELNKPTKPTKPPKPTKPTQATSPATTNPPSVITELVPGFGYYKYHPEVALWTTAVEVCRSEGGDLLVLHSQEEHDALFAQIDVPISNMLHYGARRDVGSDVYFTIFNEKLDDTGYAVWSSKPPPNDLNLILSLVRSSFYPGLAALPTFNSQPFVCKRPL